MHMLREFFRRIPRWGLVGIVACVIILLLNLGWLAARNHLKPVILGIGKVTGQKVELSDSKWKEGGYIELTNFNFTDLARIDKLDIKISPLSLLVGHIDEIRIHGGRLWLSKLIASDEKKEKEKKSSGGTLFGISIGKLVVSDSTLYLDNLCKGMAPIPLKLAETPPALVFNNLHFGGSSDNSAAKARQVATLEHFIIYSPYDPAAKVLSFRKIHVEFTWAGLQKQELEKLVFDRPTIFVGPDLFWLADDIKSKQEKSPEPEGEKAKPWTIHEFALQKGQIVLSANGQASLPLPGVIEVAPTSLVLGDFSQLHLETKFISHISEKSYPEYNIKFKNLEGDLAFNLPLGSKNARSNLVRQFTVEELDWKGITFGRKGNPAWVVLTFDEKGVYCKLGSPVSGGYINATVDIFLDDQMRWLATASATGVDLYPITKLLSPDEFLMTGKFNSQFKVNGQSREILGLGGYAKLPEQGMFRVVAVQEMKKKLPAEWPQLKKDLSLIPMEAFERYDYSYGDLEFSYTPQLSFVRLNMDGKQGKRNFEIRWREERSKVKSLILPENSSIYKVDTTTATTEPKNEERN